MRSGTQKGTLIQKKRKMQANSYNSNREYCNVSGKNSLKSWRSVLKQTFRRSKKQLSEQACGDCDPNNNGMHDVQQAIPVIKTVKFALQRNETYAALSVEDYSDDEIKACWYSDEEYQKIWRRCDKVIDKLNHGKAVNPRKYCIRGLERMTSLSHTRIECNRHDAYDAVILEQESQRKQNEYDPDRMAYLYREIVSRQCHVDAHIIGLDDAKAVEMYLPVAGKHVSPQMQLELSKLGRLPSISSLRSTQTYTGRKLGITSPFCH